MDNLDRAEYHSKLSRTSLYEMNLKLEWVRVSLIYIRILIFKGQLGKVRDEKDNVFRELHRMDKCIIMIHFLRATGRFLEEAGKPDNSLQYYLDALYYAENVDLSLKNEIQIDLKRISQSESQVKFTKWLGEIRPHYSTTIPWESKIV